MAEEVHHWLWVTTPAFYEDENGQDVIFVGMDDGWWTCSKHTRSGDLALLYRTAPRKDIAYLFLAKTHAYSIVDDDLAVERGWSWACDYEVLYQFEDPLPLTVLRGSPELRDWGALRRSFQGRAFAIQDDHWDALLELALPSNPGLAPAVGQEKGRRVPERILVERQLEDSLAADLRRLRCVGWDVELWQDPKTGRSGRQFVCAAAHGRIDLLCRDRRSGGLVVIELKNVMATERTYLQAWRYLSWVQRFLAVGRPVRSLVIARGWDSRFVMMADASEGKVQYLSLPDLGFR